MAKNKRKKKKEKKQSTYNVGYGKPPVEHQWKKGQPSPNPKGRPKKPQTLKEGIQLALNKELKVQNEAGEIKSLTCIEVLASKTVNDAIAKDGPTRRLLLSSEMINLFAKEQEYEYDPEEEKLMEVEKAYGDVLRWFAELPENLREFYRTTMTEILRNEINRRAREGEL